MELFGIRKDKPVGQRTLEKAQVQQRFCNLRTLCLVPLKECLHKTTQGQIIVSIHLGEGSYRTGICFHNLSDSMNYMELSCHTVVSVVCILHTKAPLERHGD
jgi:hypothetical protein